LLEINLGEGIIKNITKNLEISFSPLPEVMVKILGDGGLAEHVRKNRGFNL